MKKSTIQKCLRIAIEHNTPDLHPQWGDFQHFSFVIKNNMIIEWSTNYSGQPLLFKGYQDHQKIHSELMAFRRAKKLIGKDLNTFEMLNIRLSRQNKLRNSKPCDCCNRWLQDSGCTRMVYSTNDNFCISIY
jgi:hypothetical protein